MSDRLDTIYELFSYNRKLFKYNNNICKYIHHDDNTMKVLVRLLKVEKIKVQEHMEIQIEYKDLIAASTLEILDNDTTI